ncbi:MAG: YdeI/OmpD-associated family protein [Gemmatimonadales bacterium]|nr:YdeI/OmpD-associated family protein [Gemmatimonadales bacterium]
MSTSDPRIDAYIESSAPFAQSVLRHIREIVHAGCPDVEETIKWSMPHFTHHGIICAMAAFKAHCSLHFWKGARIIGDAAADREDGMGQFGRITRVADLPARRVLIGYVRKAAELNEAGERAPARPRRARPPIAPPAELTAALARSKRARETFERLAPSQRRDYSEWISEAKRAETRERRVATAVEWLAEGKTRNWKHER